jgi:hypothetical protein
VSRYTVGAPYVVRVRQPVGPIPVNSAIWKRVEEASWWCNGDSQKVVAKPDDH